MMDFLRSCKMINQMQRQKNKNVYGTVDWNKYNKNETKYIQGWRKIDHNHIFYMYREISSL